MTENHNSKPEPTAPLICNHFTAEAGSMSPGRAAASSSKRPRSISSSNPAVDYVFDPSVSAPTQSNKRARPQSSNTTHEQRHGQNHCLIPSPSHSQSISKDRRPSNSPSRSTPQPISPHQVCPSDQLLFVHALNTHSSSAPTNTRALTYSIIQLHHPTLALQLPSAQQQLLEAQHGASS